MKFATRQISLIGLLITSTSVFAYNPATHENFSEAAVDQSVLSTDATLLPSLGLKPLTAKQKFFISSLTGSRTIVDHIRNGAHIEDSFARSLNHFYNPLTQRSLLGIPSPDWALEDKEDISDQFSSFKNAREHFYRALMSSDVDEREKYFGLTFETLGNVIHHPQDMAQPQHVRDDEHCDIFPCKVIGRHNPSAYELYALNLRGALVVSGYPSIYSLASSTSFTTARNLWTTPDGKGIADYTNRNFVSAGTNFSGTETNIEPAPGLPSPNGVGAVIEKRQITDPDLRGPKGPNQPLEGAIYFIQMPVKDNLTGESVLSRTSTFSIFDADLMQAGQEAVFSLNEYNYKAASDLLTKRAVAYSAGLIDYFFRGKLEAEDVAFTDTGITLKVKNAIDLQKTPAWANEVLYAKNSNGSASSLTVAFDYQDSAGKTQYGVSNTIPVRATDTLAPGQVSTDAYNFTLTVPSEAKDVNYRLVFRGKLGQEEDAVAVGEIEPVSGFIVTPNYTPADGIGGTRAIFRRGGQWKLDERPDLIAGNIDWKGWYVNGKPTQVLTWWGPRARYFPPSPSDPYDDTYQFKKEIYQNGGIFAVTPSPVLGAALMKDADGSEWLIVICQEGWQTVYRRPNKKSSSPALYNALTAPEGWQRIGQLTPPGFVETPWFFNGDGTAAQTMVRKEKFILDSRGRLIGLQYAGLDRVKIEISGNSAQLRNLGNYPGIRFVLGCENNLPLPSSSCQSYERFYRQREMRDGMYVVAVDYVDNREVLAVISDTRLRTWDQVYSLKLNIEGNCSTGGGTAHGHALYTESGGVNIKMGSVSFNIEQRTNSYLYQVDITNNSFDATVNFSTLYEKGELNYPDGRYALISGRSVTDSLRMEGSVSNAYSIPVTIGSGRKINQEILSDMGNQSMFSFVTNASAVSSYGVSLGGHIDQCGGNLDTIEYPDNRTIATRVSGAWAVTADKNLLVSQQYADQNWLLRSFNSLTEGDLRQVIPGAPESPLYYPAGVVK